MFLDTEGMATLYLFIEPVFTEFLPSELENALLTSHDVDRIKYVMLAEKGSTSPLMNWRERESEAIQGYKTYSLEVFYDDVFGHEEWKKLDNCLKELKNSVADYCGISIVKALRPNSLRRFKLAIDVESEELSSELTLTEEQRLLIDARFTSGRAYTALTGTCDYAKSFKTAEWLYKSLREACDSISGKPSLVDLTPITASYFKAVEQYLYDFMALHTHERDNANRKLFVGKNRNVFLPSQNYRRSVAAITVIDDHIDITAQLMSPAFKEMLNLGLLTRLFGSRDRNNMIHDRDNCSDLLVDKASEYGVYEMLVDSLARVATLRNRYLHKDNLYDWKKVNEVRDAVRFAFYLLLGACKMTSDEERELGFDSGATLGDKFRLCDYINHRALMVDRCLHDGSRVLPLFYCAEVAEPLLAMTSDSANMYDQYGNPAYDGIHFKKYRIPAAGNDDSSVFFSLDNLPKQLGEGYLELISPDPFQNKHSGPLKVIFEEGQYLGALEF